jgi:hypothetical protein
MGNLSQNLAYTQRKKEEFYQFYRTPNFNIMTVEYNFMRFHNKIDLIFQSKKDHYA